MNVLISIDMEGCAGVVHTDQTRRTGADYERARVWMTLEANAAALGAFDGGAECVWVNDSHADMRNLVLESLDPRVRVISGALKPLSMVQGLDGTRANALFFVGYHGGAGTRASVLDHTYYGAVVSDVHVGSSAGAEVPGGSLDEAEINAMVAGEAGVPVALVTGDRAVTVRASERFENVVTVEVKQSITRFAADSLHPEEARRRIREGARLATMRAPTLRPYVVEPPLVLTIGLLSSGFADAAELVPGIERLDARRVRFVAASAREMLRALVTVTKIAGTVA